MQATDFIHNHLGEFALLRFGTSYVRNLVLSNERTKALISCVVIDKIPSSRENIVVVRGHNIIQLNVR